MTEHSVQADTSNDAMQRRLKQQVLDLLAVLLVLTCVAVWMTDGMSRSLWFGLVSAALCVGGALAYRRQLHHSPFVVVIGLTLLTIAGLDEPYISRAFSVAVLIPAAAGALLVEGPWVIAVAAGSYGGLLVRGGTQSSYAEPATLLIYTAIVAAVAILRFAADRADRALQTLDAAKAELHVAHAERDQLAALLEQADGVVVRLSAELCILPIVGRLEGRRANRMIEVLLRHFEQQKPRLVIVDVAGIAAIDQTAAALLQQILRVPQLVGCQVVLSGTSASALDPFVRVGISFASVEIVPSPGDVLLRYFHGLPPRGN